MTLQQMRYLIAIAECGSISAAAQLFYVSQASLSEALREVEREYGIKVFNRSNRGVTPTQEGLELIGMIRRIVQQDDLLAERFSRDSERHAVDRLAISSQRYSFVVEAIASLMDERADRSFSYVLRETDTEEILSDVRSMSSDLGVVCITSQSKEVMLREIVRSGLDFTVLVQATPSVVLSARHPLANRKTVRLSELASYPRIVFEQRNGASTFFYEDPIPEAPHTGLVAVRDRGSMVSFINMTDAYSIGSGFSTQGMDEGTISITIDTDETMQIGYLLNPRASEKPIVREFVKSLEILAHDAQGTRRRREG